jgi:hypothetical protein
VTTHSDGSRVIKIESSAGSTPVRPTTLSPRDWFRFADRNVYHPIGEREIQTDRFLHRTRNSIDDPDWERDEWSVRAMLVPLGSRTGVAAGEHLEHALDAIHAHDVTFTPGWAHDGTFDFADSGTLSSIEVLPWMRWWDDHISGNLGIHPREDFLVYHGLTPRETSAGGVDYVHPRDHLAVLRTAVEQVAYFNPTPRVTVLPDYMGDYLAARDAALLITVVADRFAHAPTDDALELELQDRAPVTGLPPNERAWITTTLHSAATSGLGHARGRASLYWNIVVSPYPRPRSERSPWHYPRIHEARDDEGPAPTFIFNAAGDRRPATDASPVDYLYFRLPVLGKYLDALGYDVFFVMRHWGQACGPGDACVDVGINERELVTAYALDIADLTHAEQQHWASYTSLPDGEVCWELWETRMQQRPPHAPNVVEHVGGARKRLAIAFRQRFDGDLYPDQGSPARDADARHMNVGPVRGEQREVVQLAQPLYTWVIESMSIGALRAPLEQGGIGFDLNARQIVLLRTVLAKVVGVGESQGQSLVSALQALNKLRVDAAHSIESDVGEHYQRMGMTHTPETPRAAWDGVVEAIVTALDGVAAALATSDGKV